MGESRDGAADTGVSGVARVDQSPDGHLTHAIRAQPELQIRLPLKMRCLPSRIRLGFLLSTSYTDRLELKASICFWFHYWWDFEEELISSDFII